MSPDLSRFIKQHSGCWTVPLTSVLQQAGRFVDLHGEEVQRSVESGCHDSEEGERVTETRGALTRFHLSKRVINGSRQEVTCC